MEILGVLTETIRSYTIIELYFQLTGFLKVNVVDSFVIICPDFHDRDRATLDRERFGN